MNSPLFASLVAIAVIAIAPAKECAQSALPAGTWGGDHVSLTVSEKGAELDFDCATGAITGPVSVGDNGAIDVAGTYTQERPGPVTLENQTKHAAAKYTGKVTVEPAGERRLSFEIKLTDPEKTIGPFVVTLGKEPRVFKCR